MGESIEWLLRISINIQVYLPIKKNYRSILSLEKLLVNHRLKGGKDRPSNIRDANIDWLMLLKMATLYIEAPW